MKLMQPGKRCQLPESSDAHFLAGTKSTFVGWEKGATVSAPASPNSHSNNGRNRRWFKGVGLSLVFVGGVVVQSRSSEGGVVSPTDSPSTFADFGANLVNFGLAHVRGLDPQGATIDASAVMLKDQNGVTYPTGSLPANDTWANLGGYGPLKLVGDAASDPSRLRAGQVSGGQGLVGPVPDFANSTYYSLTGFSSPSSNPLNYNGFGGNSGGLETDLSNQRIGIITAGGGGTGASEFTLFTRLDVPEVQDWISTTTAHGGIWALTAAHLETRLSELTIGADYDDPLENFNVTKVVPYPTWQGNYTTLDLNHPDLSLIELTPTSVPEPAGLPMMLIAGISYALLRRRATV